MQCLHLVQGQAWCSILWPTVTQWAQLVRDSQHTAASEGAEALQIASPSSLPSKRLRWLHFYSGRTNQCRWLPISSSIVCLTDRLYGPGHTDTEVFPTHSSRVEFHCVLLIRPRVLVFQHRTHANWQQARAFKWNQEVWARVQALIYPSSLSGFP